MYDTPFRSYDPQLGRFHQIDPLADKAPGINPYRFGFNNPISINDPTDLYENLAQLWRDLQEQARGQVTSFRILEGELKRDRKREEEIESLVGFLDEWRLDAGGGCGLNFDCWLRKLTDLVGSATAEQTGRLNNLDPQNNANHQNYLRKVNRDMRGLSSFQNVTPYYSLALGKQFDSPVGLNLSITYMPKYGLTLTPGFDAGAGMPGPIPVSGSFSWGIITGPISNSSGGSYGFSTGAIIGFEYSRSFDGSNTQFGGVISTAPLWFSGFAGYSIPLKGN